MGRYETWPHTARPRQRPARMGRRGAIPGTSKSRHRTNRRKSSCRVDDTRLRGSGPPRPYPRHKGRPTSGRESDRQSRRWTGHPVHRQVCWTVHTAAPRQYAQSRQSGTGEGETRGRGRGRELVFPVGYHRNPWKLEARENLRRQPVSSSRPLKPQHEEFARLYYAGPEGLRRNATRCYLAVYYAGDAHSYGTGDPEYKSAASNAYRLLKRDGVRTRMRELREEASEAAKARAHSWWELYPEAQEVLRQALRGDWPEEMDSQDKRSAVEAAVEVVDRAEGPAAFLHEHRHRGEFTVVVAGPPHPPQTASEGSDGPPSPVQ